MNHHGHLTRIVDPAHTSTMKYLACIHAAYEVTGATRFRDAAFHYLRQIQAAGRLPWPTQPYELNHNAYYYALLADYWSRSEIGQEIDWIGNIGHYWRAMQLSFDDEGIYRFGSYDAVKHTFIPYPQPVGRSQRRRSPGRHRPQQAWATLGLGHQPLQPVADRGHVSRAGHPGASTWAGR